MIHEMMHNTQILIKYKSYELKKFLMNVHLFNSMNLEYLFNFNCFIGSRFIQFYSFCIHIIHLAIAENLKNILNFIIYVLFISFIFDNIPNFMI